MPVSLTRTVVFQAIHHYRNPAWTEAENRARFGATLEPHSHDYRCAVTVTGPLDPTTAMLVDLGDLDTLLTDFVTRRFAGRSLNDVLPSGAGLPTCEALAVDVYGLLAPRLPPGVTLQSVLVAEDESLHAECTGV